MPDLDTLLYSPATTDMSAVADALQADHPEGERVVLIHRYLLTEAERERLSAAQTNVPDLLNGRFDRIDPQPFFEAWNARLGRHVFGPARAPEGLYISVFNGHINQADERARALLRFIAPNEAAEVDSIAATGIMAIFNKPPTVAAAMYSAMVAAYVNQYRTAPPTSPDETRAAS
jgi:hypothetical protein